MGKLSELFNKKSILCPNCGAKNSKKCTECLGWGTVTVPKDDPRPEFRNKNE